MNVFVVTMGNQDGDSVSGVFSSREVAEAHVEILKKTGYATYNTFLIEEIEVKDIPEGKFSPKNPVHYFMVEYINGEINEEGEFVDDLEEKWFDEDYVINNTRSKNLFYCYSKISYEDAKQKVLNICNKLNGQKT